MSLSAELVKVAEEGVAWLGNTLRSTASTEEPAEAPHPSRPSAAPAACSSGLPPDHEVGRGISQGVLPPDPLPAEPSSLVTAEPVGDSAPSCSAPDGGRVPSPAAPPAGHQTTAASASTPAGRSVQGNVQLPPSGERKRPAAVCMENSASAGRRSYSRQCKQTSDSASSGHKYKKIDSELQRLRMRCKSQNMKLKGSSSSGTCSMISTTGSSVLFFQGSFQPSKAPQQPSGATAMAAAPLQVTAGTGAAGESRGPADMPAHWDIIAQEMEVRSTMYTENGDEYTGEWLNNLRHGKGRYVYKEANAVYQGDWVRGKRSGHGTYDVKSLSTGKYINAYTGSWMDDKKHGYGTYAYSADEYYEGDWMCDKRSGWGRMFYASGDIYEGEWRNDKYCGQGRLSLANKNRYEGSWSDGMKHGPGKFYFVNKGTIYKGIWVKDMATQGILESIGGTELPNIKKFPLS